MYGYHCIWSLSAGPPTRLFHLGAQLHHALCVIEEVCVFFTHIAGCFAVYAVLVHFVVARDAPVPTLKGHHHALILRHNNLAHVIRATPQLHDGVTPRPVAVHVQNLANELVRTHTRPPAGLDHHVAVGSVGNHRRLIQHELHVLAVHAHPVGVHISARPQGPLLRRPPTYGLGVVMDARSIRICKAPLYVLNCCVSHLIAPFPVGQSSTLPLRHPAYLPASA